MSYGETRLRFSGELQCDVLVRQGSVSLWFCQVTHSNAKVAYSRLRLRFSGESPNVVLVRSGGIEQGFAMVRQSSV